MRPWYILVPLFVVPVAGRCAAGEPTDKEQPTVNVTVAVILGSERKKDVDERLKGIACQVQEMHPKLTGFTVGTTTTHPMQLGKAQTFQLEDGQEASVTVKRCTEFPDRYCLEIRSKALVGEMAYSSVCGKYFPLVTNYKTKKNEQLIIAFKVETCGDKDKPKEKDKKPKK
jgi:hypothetical protein